MEVSTEGEREPAPYRQLHWNSKLLYRIMRTDGEETHFLLRHLDEFIHRILHEGEFLFEEITEAKPALGRGLIKAQP
jgi:hypothetical protein